MTSPTCPNCGDEVAYDANGQTFCDCEEEGLIVTEGEMVGEIEQLNGD
jgi:hypothetical protein